MTEVIKLDGSPGGGKSYTLEQNLRDEKGDGLGLFGFWWLNFSTTAREDVEPVIADLWPNPGADIDPEDRAKTVHGLALSLCTRDGVIDLNDDGNDKIIVQGQYSSDEFDPFKEFCEQHAVAYDPDATVNKKVANGKNNVKTGNKLFKINDYLRQTCKPPERWRDAGVDIRIDGSVVTSLLKSWDEYKRAGDTRYYEHGDYMETAYEHGLVPDVDVLLIDEFQDLAPLEYRLYKLWRDDGGIERIYIAGDENQSVYSFRGGNPRYFAETDVDRRVTLKESYRCPSEVAKVGHSILEAHPETDPRGFEGKESGGTVEYRTVRDATGLSESVVTDATGREATPGVMLLTHTNYQLRRIASDLRGAGVPFKLLGSQSSVWTPGVTKVYNLLSAFGDRDSYPKPVVDDVLKRLPDTKQRLETLTRQKQDYTGGSLEAALADFDTVIDMAKRVSFDRNGDWKRGVLQNALDAPNDIPPDAVALGTIHSAKGLEAPTVYLFGNTSNRTVREYRRKTDYAAEIHRLYYVGATRASQKLTIIDGYFEGPVAPPIDRLRSDGVIA